MRYLGKGGHIPYLSKDEIARQAKEMLDKYWDKNLPVDVELLCDRMGISILPVLNLAKTFHIDAFISADFKTIYVDNYEFEKESHRYRFSVAHELGHYVLHRDYYPKTPVDYEKWLEVSRKILDSFAEFQANYFAGNLLVPENSLVRILNDEFNGSFSRHYWEASPRELWGALFNVRKAFAVSDQVIARRMRDAFPGVEDIF